MGRKPNTVRERMICCRCGQEQVVNQYFASKSIFYSENKKIPFCKDCIDEIYEFYCKRYKMNANAKPQEMAIKRMCMAFNVYFSKDLFKKALDQTENNVNASLINTYFRLANLIQYSSKSYDDTIAEDMFKSKSQIQEEEDAKKVRAKTIKFFGDGFGNDDYEFLQEQYEDWTTRHECNTKAQEEVFKQICFKQLELQKAIVAGVDTKDLVASFQKLLETANLQPKQNKKDTLSDAQTFGTLIDKWETTRPIPEVDPELKDVDKIGLYIDVFFKGHLAKMMGLKNGLSRLYEKYIQKYTVNKPEYNDDSDSEILFDSIFGNETNMDDDY